MEIHSKVLKCNHGMLQGRVIFQIMLRITVSGSLPIIGNLFKRETGRLRFLQERIPHFCSSASVIIYEAAFHAAEPAHVRAGAAEKGPHHGSFSFNLSICGYGFEVTAPRWKR